MKQRRGRPWKTFRRRLGQRWQALVGTELAPEKWVFVVGCYNSGTTLLANLLNAHPDMHALPREGVELCDALPRPEELGWPRMWDQCEDHVHIPAAGGAARAQRIKRQWARYATGAGIVVEKSIANVTRLEFLNAHFAPAYFIYLMRNGYAVAEGIRRRAKPHDWGNTQFTGYPLELCAQQWAKSDDYFQRDRQTLPHVLQLSYEDLTQDPNTALQQIATFLSLPAFPAEVAGRTWEVHRVNSPIVNMNADALARLSEEDLDTIDRVAGSTLSHYGYARPELPR